jgi:RHS repeat-associated protein
VKYEVNGRTDIEIKRDPSTRTETRTNARGFATTYTRNEFEQVTQVLYADGAKTSTTYEARLLNPVEETDEIGVKTRYEYDPKGNLIKKIEAAGLPEQRTTEYQIDPAGRPTSVTRKGGTESNGTVTQDASWQITYDSVGQIAQTIDPEGNRRTFVYNRAGQLAKYIDPRGNVTTYETDAKGNLIKVTDALGQIRSSSYDPNNNLSASMDARGKTIQMAYDAMNRRLQTTNQIGGQYKLRYDTNGLLKEQVDEDGRTRTTAYDIFYRITSETDALTNATAYGYQITDGSVSGSIGSLGGPIDIQYPTFKKQLKYDGRERITSVTLVNPGVSGTQSSVSQKSYDARGQLINEVDANGKNRSYKYDVFGLMLESTDALKTRIQFSHDIRGNLIQITDAKGNVTKFSYDRNDRLLKETLPLGQSVTYGYDSSGNLIERVDSNGVKKEYSYDLINRVTEVRQIKLGIGTRVVSLNWDAENRLTAWSDTDKTRPIGLQTTAATLTYDAAGRKTAETVQYPNPEGSSFTLGYGYKYSPANYKTSLVWPDGSAIDYGWSQHGELELVSIPGEGTISVNQFKWLAAAKITLPGGGVQEKVLDGMMNLEGLKSRAPSQQTTLSFVSNYGKLQEIKSTTRTDSAGALNKTENISFGYDDELRLTQVKTDAGNLFVETENFSLDALGNRVRQTRTGVGDWTYDSNNRLISRPNSDGAAVTYEYDEVGNQVKKTEGALVTKFKYDSDNRLAEVRDGVGNLSARYGYDPTNRRIWKEQYRDRAGQPLASAQRTYFLYSDEGLIAEARQPIVLNADETTSATVAPTIDTQYGLRPDSQFTTGPLFIKTKNSIGAETTAYYLHNHLDAPIQAVDRSGNVVWAASYEAFGKTAVITPNGTQDKPTIMSNLRLPGQYEDQETGLHYNWNRYADVESGRFISADPIGLGGGINRYLYSNHDPVNKVDPAGLKWKATPFDDLGRNIRDALGLECETPGLPPAFGSRYVKSQVFRDDGWDTRKGKGPNDRGTDAVTLVRADMESRGYKFVGEQVVWNYQGYSRTYDLLMQAPDGRYVAVEVKSTITGVFIDNPRQNAADVALLSNGATIIDGSGVARTVRLLSYQGVDFSSNLSAGFSSWRAGRVVRQNGGDAIIHPIGPKQ